VISFTPLPLYPQGRVIIKRRIRWARNVARVEEMRSAHKFLVGKPEGKTLLGRPRRRWDDNFQMVLKEVGYESVDCIRLFEDRVQ
jgi:hypothetical protein